MKYILVTITLAVLTACSSNPSNIKASSGIQSSGDNVYSLHGYVENLAEQLFFTAQRIHRNKSIAVGTFLPIDTLGGKKLPAQNSLGQQIQESLLTLSTQAGLEVIEFKSTKAIKLRKNQDIMLSRKVSELNADKVGTDYYLTGTYTPHSQGVIVNARLIEVATNGVVAAATGVIPTYAIGQFPSEVDSRFTATTSLYQISQ